MILKARRAVRVLWVSRSRGPVRMDVGMVR